MSFLFYNDEEATTKINLDSLFEKKKNSDLKQLSMFNKILKRIQTRIETHSRQHKSNTFVWYNLPIMIFGELTYDLGQCAGYVISKLEENKLKVDFIHPNYLYISWDHWIPSYVRREYQKKTGVVLDEVGNVIEAPEEKDPQLQPTGKVPYLGPTSVKQYRPMGLIAKPNLNSAGP
jgi:hypothetical protein